MNLSESFYPTERQRRRFIEGWMDQKREELKTLFVAEAFSEASDETLAELAYAERHGTQAELAGAFRRAIERYWLKGAEQACAEESEWGRG